MSRGGLDALLVFPVGADAVEAPELGLPSLAAYLRARGRAVRLVDQNVAHPGVAGEMAPPRSSRLPDVAAWLEREEPALDGLADELTDGLERPPRLLGLSLFMPAQVAPALGLARRARLRWPDTQVVIGGAWCAAAADRLPALLRAAPWIDGAVPYDGERPLEALLRRPPGASWDDAPGVVTAAGPGGPRPALVPLRQLPPPDYADLPLPRYPYPAFQLRTRRGCPWGHCVFCTVLHPRERAASAPLSPARAVDLARTLRRRTGLREMVLSNHLTPPDELQGLARALAAARLDLRWSAMVRFERGLRGAVLRDLATAGCRTLQFGLEAVDAADLNRLRKGVRPDTVERVLDECRAAGIRVDVTVMAFPGQRPGGFARTLAYLLERVDRVNSVTPVRFLLPSTAPVSEHPEVLGLQPQEAEDDLDVFDLPYVAPGELPADEFDTLVRDFRRAWADRGGRGGGSVA